ncbi:Protein LYK5 [Linum perenne]
MLPILLLLTLIPASAGQQSYVANHQLACEDPTFNYTTLGYLCNGPSSCKSYLTFRSSPMYSSSVYITYLLAAAATPPEVASFNNLTSDVANIPSDTIVIVPVNCSCSGSISGRRYYQHNATYTLKARGETYFSVANNTYQGLTTCQTLMSQNPFNFRHLLGNQTLNIPLRCACPTANQTAARYLLTYIVTWGDSVSAIADVFGVDQQSILDANQLSAQSTIFPFTPLLIPLESEPRMSTLVNRPPPAAPPPTTVIFPDGGGGTNSSGSGGESSKKWVFIGVGIGIGVLLLVSTLAAVKLYHRRQKQPLPLPVVSSSEEAATKGKENSTDWETESGYVSSWSLSQGVKNAVGALTVYKFHDIETATDHFSHGNKIKGSVYKGLFKGDAAAVKVMKGDLSASPEINILKKINHYNVIRLSGFCVHDGNTYLVYEYAENGSLTDWLVKKKRTMSLTWKQRVQIAHDVADALNYLHSYTNPPYIHKNLKTSNILLDAGLRGKVTNFGLARLAADQGDGEHDEAHLTRHVVGTHGYMAPEYIENGLITPKLDVFAFGVVLLELLSGKEAAARGEHRHGEELLFSSINRVLEGDNVREKLREFIDPSLTEDEYPLDLAFSLAQLAKGCVSIDLNSRPSMPQVFMTLSKILSSSLDWDPSHEAQASSASNSISQGR